MQTVNELLTIISWKNSWKTLLQPPYLVLPPPPQADQPARTAGPKTKKWWDLGLENREGRRNKPVVSPQRVEDEGIANSPQW